MTPVYDLSLGLAVWLIQAVLLGTTLALLTWGLARWLLRSARPAVHATLWLVVLAKFILPPGPGFDYSLASLIGLPQWTEAVAPATETANTTFVLLETEAAGTSALLTPIAESSAAPAAAALVPGASGLPRSGVIAFAGLYLLGVVVVVGWRVRAYRRFVREANRLPLAGRGLRKVVANLCRRSGVRRVPRVRLSDATHAPYVFGLVRPTLVLPRSSAIHGAELEAILLHEIAHLRRFDLIVRLAQWVAGNLLFFWPVVAWVNRRIDLAREHACDEWALAHGRLEPGQYARCLLRALQTQPPSWGAYRPAAMATTVQQVERRITMIMNHERRATPSHWRMLATGTVTAWAAFALTGTSAALEEPVETEEHSVWVTPDGTTYEVAMPAWVADQHNGFVFHGVGGGPGEHTFAFARHIDEASLAAFAGNYPEADVDGDGNVSQREHDAYLTAVAMADPTSVLERFPNADRNGDGTLAADEAAGLVSGLPALDHLMHGEHNMLMAPDGKKMVIRTTAGSPADGEVFAWSDEAPQNLDVDVTTDESGKQVVRINRDGQTQVVELDGDALIETEDGVHTAQMQIIALDDGSGEVQVFRSGDELPEEIQLRLDEIHAQMPDDVQAHLDALHEQMAGGQIRVEVTDDGTGPKTEVMLTGEPGMFEMAQAGNWLLENIDARPTREQVAGFLQTVTELPLAEFLKLNPDADHNRDGVLTERERDAFVKRHTSRQRMRLIEKYPEADANGDGMLTNEELREYFRSRHQGHRPAETDAAPADVEIESIP